MITAFLNSLYTIECINCKEQFEFRWQNCFCDNCINSIVKEKSLVYCRSCGDGVSNCQRCLKNRYFKDIEVFCSFSGTIKKLIYEYKLNGRKSLSKILADKIKDDFTDFVKEKEIDMIVYVPLHKTLEKERGFNHLKQILTKIFPSYMIFDHLQKIKSTKLQTQLSKEERRENLKGAFKLNQKVDSRNIAVFDDVLTTGATLMEIFHTIKKSGYNGNIYGYVITKS